MMHGSAPLVSLQRSRVIPTEYQLVPVVMALGNPRVRLLVADDVGLDKIIEAGMVVTELLSRQMARNLLVVEVSSRLPRKDLRRVPGSPYPIVNRWSGGVETADYDRITFLFL
jgi:hypothetical protein